MIGSELLNDSAFSDPGRLLQQTQQPTSSNSTYESGNVYDAATGIWFFAIQIFLVFCGFVCMYLSCRSSRVDAPVSQKSRKRSRSTFDQRKQAILEQFETSQVTMVSNEETLMLGRHENTKFTPAEISPKFNPFRK
jgi:hypothetical protein